MIRDAALSDCSDHLPSGFVLFDTVKYTSNKRPPLLKDYFGDIQAKSELGPNCSGCKKLDQIALAARNYACRFWHRMASVLRGIWQRPERILNLEVFSPVLKDFLVKISIQAQVFQLILKDFPVIHYSGANENA